VVEALDLAVLGRDQVGGRAGLLDRLAGLGVLDLLDAVGSEERDLLTLQLASHAINSFAGTEDASTSCLSRQARA
jgi:hypothetical protein